MLRTGWKAPVEGAERSLEAWYGSAALLEAAARKLAPHRNVLDRITPGFLGRAATVLDIDSRQEIARRIDASIRRAAGYDADRFSLRIEIASGRSPVYRPNIRVNEQPSKPKDLGEVARRLSESDQAFGERQERLHNAFREFDASLSKENAHIILDDLGLEDFAAVVEADETLASEWYDLFMSMPDGELPDGRSIGTQRCAGPQSIVSSGASLCSS